MGEMEVRPNLLESGVLGSAQREQLFVRIVKPSRREMVFRGTEPWLRGQGHDTREDRADGRADSPAASLLLPAEGPVPDEMLTQNREPTERDTQRDQPAVPEVGASEDVEERNPHGQHEEDEPCRVDLPRSCRELSVRRGRWRQHPLTLEVNRRGRGIRDGVGDLRGGYLEDLEELVGDALLGLERDLGLPPVLLEPILGEMRCDLLVGEYAVRADFSQELRVLLHPRLRPHQAALLLVFGHHQEVEADRLVEVEPALLTTVPVARRTGHASRRITAATVDVALRIARPAVHEPARAVRGIAVGLPCTAAVRAADHSAPATPGAGMRSLSSTG